MISKSYIILILILLAITASLEALPKYVVLGGLAPPYSSSPLSKDPYGTYYLVQLLKSQGYKVNIVGTPNDLNYLNASKVLVIIVSPTYISKSDMEDLFNALYRYKEVSLIVADELSGLSNSLDLSLMASRIFCPGYLIYPQPLTKPLYPKAFAIISLEGKNMYSLLTGYVTEVKVYGVAEKIEYTFEFKNLVTLPLIISANKYERLELFGLVAGVETSGNLSKWVPYGIICRNALSYRTLMVLGDGSIFINEALKNDGAYEKAVLSLINYATHYDKSFNIIFIEDFYLTPTIRLKYRFLPSIFLTWIADTYKNIEKSIYNIINTEKPILIFLLSLAFTLLPLSFIPKELRNIEKEKVLHKKENFDYICKKVKILYEVFEEIEKEHKEELERLAEYCSINKRSFRYYLLLKVPGIKIIMKRRILKELERLGINI